MPGLAVIGYSLVMLSVRLVTPQFVVLELAKIDRWGATSASAFEIVREYNVSLIVQKYGGSSVADAEGLKRVAKRIVETRKAGHEVVVVVSAMGDTTDELLDLAEKVVPVPSGRELDMLLTAGERISLSLIHI